MGGMRPEQIPTVGVDSIPADAVLVDVRELEEWQAGHAADAVHVPMSALPGRAEDIPADRDVVVVCRSGNRSAQVTAYLNQAGWRCINLAGGMIAWQQSGRPMVSETAVPPVVM